MEGTNCHDRADRCRVDASAPSRAAAEWAAGDARLRGLPLRIVHIDGAEPAGGAAAKLLSLGSRAACTVLGLRDEDRVPGWAWVPWAMKWRPARICRWCWCRAAAMAVGAASGVRARWFWAWMPATR